MLDEGCYSGGVGEGVVIVLVEVGFGYLLLCWICGVDMYILLVGVVMFGFLSDNVVIGVVFDLV